MHSSKISSFFGPRRSFEADRRRLGRRRRKGVLGEVGASSGAGSGGLSIRSEGKRADKSLQCLPGQNIPS